MMRRRKLSLTQIMVGLVTMALLLSLLDLNNNKNDGDLDTPPIEFDFYVMAMSHQPEFCYQHRHEDFVGCRHPLEFWKGHLTIHGMWPQFANGTWPSSCSNEPFSFDSISDMASDLDIKWPNVKVEKRSQAFPDFWKHEWSKHGTCSGLTQHVYFQSALTEFLKTPDIVGENYGAVIAKSDLEQAYGGEVVLVCSGGKYLEEVRICLNRQADGRPTGRVSCPESVLREDTCERTIHISTFPKVIDTKM